MQKLKKRSEYLSLRNSKININHKLIFPQKMNYQLALLNRRYSNRTQVADVPDLMLIIADFCEDDTLSNLSRVPIPYDSFRQQSIWGSWLWLTVRRDISEFWSIITRMCALFWKYCYLLNPVEPHWEDSNWFFSRYWDSELSFKLGGGFNCIL